MSVTLRVYSPAEAAAVSDVGIKAIHNAIDKQVLEPIRIGNSNALRKRRSLTGDDLVRLKLWYGIGAVLSTERRKRLFAEISARPSAKMIKADDLLIVDVGEARRQVALRVRDLDQAEAAIHSVKGVMGGEAVFKGTRIPVRTVTAMLADGASESEILEGYPSLNARMLKLAKLWVLAHPRRGRPKALAADGYFLKSTKRKSLHALRGDPSDAI